ncbi:hypothetical protein [Peribacillus loiseleuriae]|uniref:hypothetical protein n=1 Tax=Peribacillus loiseleuriae TaxID=1679170 RepID=UPI000ACC56A4|nr:hypothetical protein [Peribacillus loiseleuriae]
MRKPKYDIIMTTTPSNRTKEEVNIIMEKVTDLLVDEILSIMNEKDDKKEL